MANNTMMTPLIIRYAGQTLCCREIAYGPVNAATDFGPQQNHVDYVKVGITSNLLVENNY